MKKLFYSLITGVIGFFGLIMPLTSTPVYAECPEGTVPVSMLGDESNIVTGTNGERCLKDDGEGSGIISILNFVVNVMTVGIGILAAIGITVVGTQYLTAGGNEEQTRKAKRRLIEIVIGVAAYVVIYALLVWLLPGFNGFGS